MLSIIFPALRRTLECEICDAHRPSMSLRGSSEKYRRNVLELRARLAQLASRTDTNTFPTVLFSNLKVKGGRIGAFELTLLIENPDDEPVRVPLSSKLQSGRFPHIASLITLLRSDSPCVTDAQVVAKLEEELKAIRARVSNMETVERQKLEKYASTLREKESALDSALKALNAQKERIAYLESKMNKSDTANELRAKSLALESKTREVHAQRERIAGLESLMNRTEDKFRKVMALMHKHELLTEKVTTEEERRMVFAEVQKMNSNYKGKGTREVHGVKKDGFEGIFGDQAVFYEGLEAYAGRAMVAKDEQLFEAMKREFNECADGRVHFIKTTNYGGLVTDLATEWEFAAESKDDKLYPGQVLMCVCACACACAYMYMYTCAYMYMYIHMYHISNT